MIEVSLILLFAQWWRPTNTQSSFQPPKCYWSANETLDSVFSPCGDPTSEFKSCCEGGDNCLANNACYSPYYGTTYLAGCTDPDYTDISCPDKPNLEDHSWVGLVTCNHISTNWFACGDNAPTVTHGMGCTCPQTSATLAFTAADSPIQAIMQLGEVYPESSCFPSFSIYCSQTTQASSSSSITDVAAPSSTATSANTASRTTSAPLSTNSGGSAPTVSATQLGTASTDSPIPTPPSNYSGGTTAGDPSPTDSSYTPDAEGLQTQAKIGIGIGSAAGAVFLGALFWYSLSCIKKRQKNKSAENQTGPNSTNDAMGPVENQKLGDDDPRSPTWSGHKSELPAGDPRSPTRSAYKSELSADDTEVRSPVPTYEPYRGSYKSSRTADAEHSPKFGGQTGVDRGGLYEMP